MTRVLVYEDSVYCVDEAGVSTDRAFLLFAAQLCGFHTDVTMLGRVDPARHRSYYGLPHAVHFVGTRHYDSLASPAAVRALGSSFLAGWRALKDVDVAWLMGPHPLSVLLAGLAWARGTPVVLGVRQDLAEYARRRHPDRPVIHWAADRLEGVWRRLARSRSVVVVGPDLARKYASARRLLEMEVSLVRVSDYAGERPSYDDEELRLLSVGRIDTEKNPLLLADVLAKLRTQDPRWRLSVCGEGPLQGQLAQRLRELGVAEHAELAGYVPVDRELPSRYVSSHVFLHTSWTEGLPQVLLEAWAAGVPVVATAVGGVPEVAQDAALLVPPGDADAAVDAVRTLAGSAAERDRLTANGTRKVLERTMERTLERLAAFIDDAHRGVAVERR